MNNNLKIFVFVTFLILIIYIKKCRKNQEKFIDYSRFPNINYSSQGTPGNMNLRWFNQPLYNRGNTELNLRQVIRRQDRECGVNQYKEHVKISENAGTKNFTDTVLGVDNMIDSSDTKQNVDELTDTRNLELNKPFNSL